MTSLERMAAEMQSGRDGGGWVGGRGAGAGGLGRGRGRGGFGPAGRVHGGHVGAMSPALLTSLIKKASTVESLFQTCSAHEQHMNHIHLSACWNSLGNLARTAAHPWCQAHAMELESLVQHTTEIVWTSSQITHRELANIAHGVAKSGQGSSMVPLMTALARAIQSRLGACNAQELANVAWAFAKAGHLDAELFSGLARAAEQCLDNFKPQELANTAWAFATAGHSDAQLFKALAQTVAQRLDDFIMQGLANTAWAFAKAGYFDGPLFGAMAKVAEQRLGDCNAQDLANIAWAYAKLGHFDAQLFSALAGSTERQLDRFNAQV